MGQFEQIGEYLRRILVYSVGLFCIAFGVALSINSNLGVSPVNSLPFIISEITQIEMGNCVIAVFTFYTVIQILLLRKNFRWVDITQVLFAMMFGFFVDFAKWVVGDFAIPTYFGSLIMMVVSVILVAIGVCLYMNVRLVNMPSEGLAFAIKEVFAKERTFHDVKVWMDCTVVGMSCVLSFIFLGEIEGIREGTVISAIFVGKVMKVVGTYLVPVLERFVWGEIPSETENI